jgi:hypothetical protein
LYNIVIRENKYVIPQAVFLYNKMLIMKYFMDSKSMNKNTGIADMNFYFYNLSNSMLIYKIEYIGLNIYSNLPVGIELYRKNKLLFYIKNEDNITGIRDFLNINILHFKVEWKIQRLFWIAFIKNNDNNICYISKLPKEIIHYIIKIISGNLLLSSPPLPIDSYYEEQSLYNYIESQSNDDDYY